MHCRKSMWKNPEEKSALSFIGYPENNIPTRPMHLFADPCITICEKFLADRRSTLVQNNGKIQNRFRKNQNQERVLQDRNVFCRTETCFAGQNILDAHDLSQSCAVRSIP